MHECVIMPRTSGLFVGLLSATVFIAPAAAETAPASGSRAAAAEEAAAGSAPSLPRGATIRPAGRRYVAQLSDGGSAELTLDPRLQQSTENVLRAFQIPFGDRKSTRL